MNDWLTATLEELCTEGGGFVRTGPFGSQLHQSDYIDDPNGIPVVMPKDMVNGRVDHASVARVSTETAERLAHHLTVPGDIVLARRGDVGRSVAIRSTDIPALVGTGSVRIHLGTPERVDPRYFEYFMRSRHVVDYLEGQAVGATMPNLNAGIVNSLPVFIPPLAHQRNTAEALGSIDDLIENNRRRVENLEEMAQAIYREWFVHFRFPGHEDATFVDSSLGPLPAGWSSSILGDVDNIRLAKPKVNCFEGSRRYIATADCSGFHRLEEGERLRFDALPSRAQHVPIANSVWFGRMAGYRKNLVFLDESPDLNELVLSSGFACLSCSDTNWATFAACWIMSSDFEDVKARHATGATQISLTDAGARNLPLMVPGEDIVRQFANSATPLIQLALSLLRQVTQLESLRNLLLPKLVTGEIDVSGLDLDALMGAAS